MKVKNLKQLDESRLHHPELGQLIKRFYDDFEYRGLDPATDADFGAMYDAMKAELPTYNLALDQVEAQEETKHLAVGDQKRDGDWQSLKDSIKPFKNSDDPAEIEAYHALSLLFNEYKGVENDEYEQETNRMDSMLTRVKSAPYTAHTATLGNAKFVDRLQASETAFGTLFTQRSSNVSMKTVYNVKQLRKALTEKYEELAGYTATMAGVKKSAFFVDALAVINAGRTYFADTVLARRVPKKKEEGKGV